MNAESPKQLDLSVVVPLYNEEDSIKPLLTAITNALGRIDCTSEVIFVDDGSADGTFAVAESLAEAEPRLRVVKFRRNYGQTPAMAAGIDVSRGSVIVTMDGDLQNDPDDIPLFLEKIEEGFDIVVGWRFDRQDKLVSRKIPSRIANWIIGKVTGVEIKDNGCSLKAFRADIIKNVPLYSEMHRFIPAMASMAGPRIAEIKVRHHARQYGESKYGLSRVYKVLLDLLTIKTISGFATTPLLWFSLLALPFFMLALATMLGGIMTVAISGTFSIPILGSGLFFLSLALFFLLSGGLAELVVRTGDTAAFNLPLITVTERSSSVDGRDSRRVRRALS